VVESFVVGRGWRIGVLVVVKMSSLELDVYKAGLIGKLKWSTIKPHRDVIGSIVKCFVSVRLNHGDRPLTPWSDL